MATEVNGNTDGKQLDREIERRLKLLSERVRATRARRGMTRKNLSRHSGISERYLAQLENGGANVSIVLMWRIANAMDVGLHELLPDQPSALVRFPPLADLLKRLSPAEEEIACTVLSRQFPTRRGPYRGVVLIGLRGAGKTTLGRRLAERFALSFVRISEVVERLGGMQLDELFELGGQKRYRRLEREAVRYVIGQCPRSVIETGGSLVSEPESFSLLRSTFYTVWVRTTPEEHMNRVISQGDMRPMAGGQEAMDDLRRILAEREPYYRSANYMLNTSARTIDDCVDELAAACAPHLERSAHESS